PTFDHQPDLLPLGLVADRAGTRHVGVRLSDTLFSYMAGRSRYGKTETALHQFLHLALSGHGCLFLDPHEDAIARVKPYLADVAHRVVEVNVSPRSQRQVSWNLFAN